MCLARGYGGNSPRKTQSIENQYYNTFLFYILLLLGGRIFVSVCKSIVKWW